MMTWVCLQFVIMILEFCKTLRVFRFGESMLPAR